MRKNNVAAFKFQPFSKKQKKAITWWMPQSPHKDKDILIADGSIRAGKTVALIDGFMNWSLDTFSHQNFIISGKSMGALSRNVLNPLKQNLAAKGIAYRHVRSEEPRIEVGTNTYYLFGANDIRSKDTLQGLTAAGALADEVALFPENFVKEMINRCSIDGSKLWWNCNPQSPNHFIKKEFIDQADKKNILRLHFTLDDNLTLSDKIKSRYRRMFEGMWYQRNILGLWVLAEGLIYDMFNKDTHLVTDKKRQKEILEEEINRYYIANDYGTGTVFALGLFGVTHSGESYLIKSFYYDAKKKRKQKSDSQYAADLKKFMKGYKVSRIIIPDDALSFINECRDQKVGNIKVFSRDPGTVLDGIRLQADMLATQQYKIFANKSNQPVIDEYYSYIWDEKAQLKGNDKPVKENDHGKDMERYFHLVVNGKSGVSFLT
ncbi:MAG: PBSX family phage terminase large subunit [Halanaerobiales bacterium]